LIVEGQVSQDSQKNYRIRRDNGSVG